MEEDQEDALSLGQRTYERQQVSMATSGFREGISVGHEVTLQEGFNLGYNQAFRKTMELAHLRGKLTAALCQSHTSGQKGNASRGSRRTYSKDLIGRLESALKDLSAAEGKLAKESTCCTSECGRVTEDEELEDKSYQTKAGTESKCCEGTGGTGKGCCSEAQGDSVYSVEPSHEGMAARVEKVQSPENVVGGVTKCSACQEYKNTKERVRELLELCGFSEGSSFP